MNKTSGTSADTKQSRLKSWPMWLGILSAIWMLALALGIPQRIGLTNDAYSNIITAIGTILTLLGVVNNPTNPKGL